MNPASPVASMMIAALLLSGSLSARELRAQASAAQRDRDRNDEIEVVVRGCLKGRDLTAEDVAGHVELERELDPMFRLSGKGDIGDRIKRFNGRRVEVTGFVKKTALAKRGLTLGGGRVVIGGGGISRDPTRDPARSAERRLYPMEVTVIDGIGDRCEG